MIDFEVALNLFNKESAIIFTGFVYNLLAFNMLITN